MRRTRSVLVVLALGLLGSLVMAPAADAKGKHDHGPKGAKAGAVEAAKPPKLEKAAKPDHPGGHLDCARVAEKVAKLQAKRVRAGERHGRAGVDGLKAAGRLAHIDDEIARAQAACI